MTLNAALFSSRSDHWFTPPDFYAALHGEFAFTFDPCPLMSEESGLLVPWTGRVFCNPPYSKIGEFIRKGLWHLHAKDAELVVYLIPARTDTAWFHDFIYGKAEIRFVRGRLKFGGKGSAPFPSMVVVFREAHIAALPLVAA